MNEQAVAPPEDGVAASERRQWSADRSAGSDPIALSAVSRNGKSTGNDEM